MLPQDLCTYCLLCLAGSSPNSGLFYLLRRSDLKYALLPYCLLILLFFLFLFLFFTKFIMVHIYFVAICGFISLTLSSTRMSLPEGKGLEKTQ